MGDLLLVAIWVAVWFMVRPYYDWYRQHQAFKRHEEEGS